jgi:alpha,alpha-trehalase
MTRSNYPPIADYALIGDCHTAALISREGSIDWYCPERFDAPAAFCRILDSAKGGYLRVAPTQEFSSERAYRGHTNVLETTFTTSTGRVRVTDCMPEHNRLMRRVEGLSGEVELAVEFKPSFNYARAKTQIDGGIAHAGNQYLTLAGPSGRFTVRSGACHWLVLSYTESAQDAQGALHVRNCEKELENTLQYWEDWAAKCTYKGPYRDQVLRSALVLKLLTFEPTGAVVAAPTTSLPENIGGERNWDYRFTWLRDSALILYALQTIGYDDGAADFMHWLERTVGKDATSRPQIMYGIDGRRDLSEERLDDLDGYCHSRPVRIGNAAATQVQLDIYGEVLRAAGLHYHRGRRAVSGDAWRVLRGLVENAAKQWEQAGSGIWEVRGGPEHFLYGKLMCWAALDSGIRLARDHKLDAPLEKWGHTREQIRRTILQRGYNSDIGAFTQALDSSALDASALVVPRVGFLPPTDPRVRSTVQQIQQKLSKDGLVFRYRAADGLAGGEGTFTLCTFWLVDALALGGEQDRAHALFERTLRCTNDLGLLAEEIDPDSGSQLGNFPQGFSHLALIGAAVNLAKAAQHGSEHRAENEGERAERAGPAASR